MVFLQYDQLNGINMLLLLLVFFKIALDYDPYGCFSMVMTEPLHALEAGILPYLREFHLSETPEKEIKARPFLFE